MRRRSYINTLFLVVGAAAVYYGVTRYVYVHKEKVLYFNKEPLTTNMRTQMATLNKEGRRVKLKLENHPPGNIAADDTLLICYTDNTDTLYGCSALYCSTFTHAIAGQGSLYIPSKYFGRYFVPLVYYVHQGIRYSLVMKDFTGQTLPTHASVLCLRFTPEWPAQGISELVSVYGE